jgi:hypothetical protein
MWKLPAGGIASTVAPGRSPSAAQLEKRPPGTRLIATRSSSSCTAEQMEYDRRTSSCPSASKRKVRYWPCVKRKASRCSSGTRSVITTASRVSRRASATVSG